MDLSKKNHILETAMKLFNENGFHNTPTSKIAKAAGVSVGTLFNYFPTKEDLILEIYTVIKTHSRGAFIEHLLKEELPVYDLMKDMWHTIVIWGLENPEEFHYLNLFTHSPFKKMFQNEKLMEEFAKLRELLLKGISPSPACRMYPEFSMIYMSNAFTATTEFLLHNDVDDKDHFVDSAFDLFWRGFSQR